MTAAPRRSALVLLCLCLAAAGCAPGGANPAATDSAPARDVPYAVTVTDRNGTPVAGAEVQLCGDSGCQLPALTGEDGTVRFTLPEGRYRASVTRCPEGYEADPDRSFDFPEGETSLTVFVSDIRLDQTERDGAP